MEVKAYRVGQVTRDEMTIYACCNLVPKEKVILEYIEVEFSDGSHKFYYEDAEGFEHFEKNFVSKRFTSYHEFFTTDELAIENRGSLKLKYYVRRDESSYERVNLTEKARELDELAKQGLAQKLNNRITVYGQYDIVAKNNWEY